MQFKAQEGTGEEASHDVRISVEGGVRKELPDEIVTVLNNHRVKCRQRAIEIVRDYGTLPSYCSKLIIETICKPDDPQLRNFYELYKTIFVLPDERETIDGFANVLALIADAKVQSKFGPLYEPILVARDPGTNQMVGAVNFTVYTYPRTIFEFDASCQVHFLLVREDMRGLGIGSYLLHVVEDSIASFAHRHCSAREPRAFMTCEQNNPDRMTRDQINADAQAALIDPYIRMKWWRERGFKRLDFRYLQPPLSVELQPCEYLDYYARPCNVPDKALDALPSEVLLEHLRRFFFVSVGKLAIDMANNSQWRAMQSSLSEFREISLI